MSTYQKHKQSVLDTAQACLDYQNNPDQFPFEVKLPTFCCFLNETDCVHTDRELRGHFKTWEAEKRKPEWCGRLSDKPESHWKITNMLHAWDDLTKRGLISGNLNDRCHEILGTDTTAKQLRPFTSEEFESSFAVGAIVRIRLSKDKNIKRSQLAEIEYKPDSESQIQSVTFGGKEYTLPELKDNLEYWRHDQWHPFGVIE